MRLFLASEAKNPIAIERLRLFIDGFKGKSIAYIPTAANGEEPFGSWKVNAETWKLVQTLGATLTVVQLEDYKDASAIKALRKKDIVWFAGGSPGYLMYWVRRCELDKALPDLLETSVYVGSSAGSMIASNTLDVVEWYVGDREIGASSIPGLGLVDFDIYPHYEDSLLPQIRRHYQGHKLYLLKNDEAIVVEGRKVRVLGEERIVCKLRSADIQKIIDHYHIGRVLSFEDRELYYRVKTNQGRYYILDFFEDSYKLRKRERENKLKLEKIEGPLKRLLRADYTGALNEGSSFTHYRDTFYSVYEK